MKLLSRILLWTFPNGGMVYCFYMAQFHGQEWGKNLIVFFVWLWVPLSLALLHSKASGQSTPRPTMPQWVNAIFDIGMMLALVAFGWWWTAIAYLLGACFQHAAWSGDKQPTFKVLLCEGVPKYACPGASDRAENLRSKLAAISALNGSPRDAWEIVEVPLVSNDRVETELVEELRKQLQERVSRGSSHLREEGS